MTPNFQSSNIYEVALAVLCLQAIAAAVGIPIGLAIVWLLDR